MSSYRRWRKVVVAGLFLSGLAYGESADRIKNLDRQWAEATILADVSALEKILSPDLTYTHTDGITQSKAQFIEAVRSGELKCLSIEFRDAKTRIYGNTAVTTSQVRVKLRAQGQEISLRPIFLHVYVKQHGHWQMVAHQATRSRDP